MNAKQLTAAILGGELDARFIEIYGDETELGGVTLHPLEIIAEAPMVIPLHRKL